MPFQVSHSNKKSSVANVTLLSAGVIQVIICGTTVVTLNAEVDDPANLVGHDLLWEQLSGVPVVLNTPTLVTTTYTIIDASDKAFRFWIDKGTVDEQFSDVLIFRTPTTRIIPGAFNKKPQPHSSANVGNVVLAGTVVTPPLSKTVDPDVAGVPGVSITWSEPSLPDLSTHLSHTEIYYRSTPTGTDSLLGTVFPGTTNFKGPEGYYTISTVFNIDGSIISFTSDLIRAIGYGIDGLFHVVDELAPASYFHQSPAVATRYTTIIFSTPESSTLQIGAFAPALIDISRYGNIFLDTVLPTQITPGAMGPASVINIVRSNPSGIGGSV